MEENNEPDKHTEEEKIEIIKEYHKPMYTLDDVIGQPEAVEAMKRFISGLKMRDVLKKFKIDLPKGYLFHGEPGTGKSMLAEIVSYESGCMFQSHNIGEIGSSYINKTAKNVRKIFEDSVNLINKYHTPVLLFFDEFDSIGGERIGSTSGSREDAKVVNVFNQYLDGDKAHEDIFVIAATNFPERLDSALTRAGRFNRWVKFNEFDKEGIEQLLVSYIQKHQKNIQGNIFEKGIEKKVSQYCLGFNGADCKEIIRRTIESRLYDVVDSLKDQEATDDQIQKMFVINDEYMINEINKYKNSRNKKISKRIGF